MFSSPYMVFCNDLHTATVCMDNIMQSRQSAKLFLQWSELGLPQPLTRRRLPAHHLLPVSGGGAHSLAR
jgi:hypothetical protein